VIAADSVDVGEECRLTLLALVVGSQDVKNGADIDDAPCCIAAGLSPSFNKKFIKERSCGMKLSLRLWIHKREMRALNIQRKLCGMMLEKQRQEN
jgi:hypothetical protein